MYGAIEAAMVADICDKEIHRPLDASGVIEPTDAPIKGHSTKEAPFKKEAKAKAAKLLKQINKPKEKPPTKSAIVAATIFPNLSPILPTPIENRAEPKKLIEPNTPMWKLSSPYTSWKNWTTRGLTRLRKKNTDAKNSDSKIIFLAGDEFEPESIGEICGFSVCWLRMRKSTLVAAP